MPRTIRRTAKTKPGTKAGLLEPDQDRSERAPGRAPFFCADLAPYADSDAEKCQTVLESIQSSPYPLIRNIAERYGDIG